MPVITVSESAENRVEIDLRFTRSLEFQVQRPNGENYGGRFTFELQPRSGGAVEMMSFAQAPYLLRGVLPGDYLALFFDPFSTRVERPLSITKSSTEGKIVYDVSEQ